MDGYVDGDADIALPINKALLKPNWDDWLFKDTDRRAELLKRNYSFQDQIQKIRTKYKIKPNLYRPRIINSQKLVITWLESLDQIQLKDWIDYVTYIMYKAHLSPGWRTEIQAYILTDILLAPPAILIHDTPDKHSFLQLQIRINDTISKSDFDKLYTHIEGWLEHHKYQPKNTKRMPYPHMPYYLIMHELRKVGLSNADIAETLSANFEAEPTSPTFTTRFIRDSLNRLDQLIAAQMS